MIPTLGSVLAMSLRVDSMNKKLGVLAKVGGPSFYLRRNAVMELYFALAWH